MEVPSKYKTAGTLMLVSGIYNVMMSLFLEMIICFEGAMFGIATFGIGCVICVCGVWPLIQLGMGIVEILTGYRVMQGEPNPNAKTISIAGIVVGVLMFGMIPIILEVIAMISLQDEEVTRWLEGGSMASLT